MRRRQLFTLVQILCISAHIAVISGCASSPTPVTYYLLRGEHVEGSSPVDAPIRVGLGRIVVAPYLLSGNGIMLETEPGVIRPAIQHQWAEPLDAGLRWYLRSEVGSESGYQLGGGLTDRHSWDYVVDVYIARMHATMSGTAILEAAFKVSSTRGEGATEYRFSKSIPLAEDGYAGVVESHKTLIREVARLIADSLRDEMAPEEDS